MSSALVKLGFTYDQLVDDGFPIDSAKIEEIKNWLITKSLHHALTAEQITLFLLSCDENVEFTKVTIEAYFRIKYREDEIFNNRRIDDDDVKKGFDLGTLCLWQTSERYAVVFYKLKPIDCSNFSLKQLVKVTFMAIESATFDYPVKGLLILTDLEHMTMRHLLRITPKTLKITFDYLQEALPVKLVKIHVFNTAFLLNSLLAIITPFMRKTLLEKVHFHPKNLDWNKFYQQHMPKSEMCEDYGGDLPSTDLLEQLTKQKFKDMEEYFNMEELSRRKNCLQ